MNWIAVTENGLNKKRKLEEIKLKLTGNKDSKEEFDAHSIVDSFGETSLFNWLIIDDIPENLPFSWDSDGASCIGSKEACDKDWDSNQEENV